MNFLNPKKYLLNQTVEELCGLEPINFEAIDIASDPNFIFQNESLKIKQKNPADLILSDRLKSL